mmetsp:Transcript_73100/g.169492  ORF Transcript_73100/g.169492 Transcript_73100/m.169492 type:complete len:338 (+) Transcript_73100:1-1014(+)
MRARPMQQLTGMQAGRLVLVLWLTVGRALARGHGASKQTDRSQSLVGERCLGVVSLVEASGNSTEDSISGICAAGTGSPECGFFAEVLALAIAHDDFAPHDFCLNVQSARVCAENMDDLFLSQPVADLAYGECMRSKQADAYCKRFRWMLADAVENGDLDTMRACYMLQAYSGSVGGQSMSPEGAPAWRGPAALVLARRGTNSTVGTELASLVASVAAGKPPLRAPTLRPAPLASALHEVPVSVRPAEKLGGSNSTVTKRDARRTLEKASRIVTHIVPLSPLAGHLATRRVPTSAHTTAGLAQEGSAKIARATRRASAEAKLEGKPEYNGFLSKFVQ